METVKTPLYAYIKGSTYKEYKVVREQDDTFSEINETFDTFDELIAWVYQFSNFNSIPVQFYQ